MNMRILVFDFIFSPMLFLVIIFDMTFKLHKGKKCIVGCCGMLIPCGEHTGIGAAGANDCFCILITFGTAAFVGSFGFVTVDAAVGVTASPVDGDPGVGFSFAGGCLRGGCVLRRQRVEIEDVIVIFHSEDIGKMDVRGKT